MLCKLQVNKQTQKRKRKKGRSPCGQIERQTGVDRLTRESDDQKRKSDKNKEERKTPKPAHQSHALLFMPILIYPVRFKRHTHTHCYASLASPCQEQKKDLRRKKRGL